MTGTIHRWFAIAVLALVPSVSLTAQHRPVNGMRPADIRAHAFVDVTIVLAPGNVLEHATLIVRDGVIEAVGANITVPVDARVWDTEGLTIYPGLIEPACFIDAAPQASSAGLHWNSRIVPQVNMADEAVPSDALRSSLRSLGFTVAAVYPSQGALRGTGVVMSLAENADHLLTFEADVAMAMAFDYGGGFGGGGGGAGRGGEYPNSLMGSVAQIRQTLLDAQWHAACHRVYAQHPLGNEPPLPSEALDALGKVIDGSQPVLFDVRDEVAALRAARIMREFSLRGVILGSGTEFARLDEIVALGVPFLLPLEFPRKPTIDDASQAEQVSLREMQMWEQAPTNPRRLMQAGVHVALTTHKLRDRGSFFAALQKSIQQGLTEDQALASLTTVPAKLLGIDGVVGTIQPGKIANFILVEGSLFDSKPKIRDVWVSGRRHEITKKPPVTLAAKGTITTSNGFAHEMEIDTEKSAISITLPPKPEAPDHDAADDVAPPEAENEGPNAEAVEAPQADDAQPPAPDDAPAQGERERRKPEPKPRSIKARGVKIQQDRLSAVIDAEPFGEEGFAQISGAIVGERVIGSGVLPSGNHFTFTFEPAAQEDASKDQGAAANPPGDTPAEKADAHEKDEPAADEKDEVTDEEAAWNTRRAKVSGTWRAALSRAGKDEPLTIQITVRTDGTIIGSVSALGEVRPVVSGVLERDASELRLNVASPDLEQPISITAEPDLEAGVLRGSIVASGLAADFEASRRKPGEDAKEKESDAADGETKDDNEPEPVAELAPETLLMPLGEYGLSAPPAQVSVLVINATIWTSGPAGIIENGFLGVRGGKIAVVGNLQRDADTFRAQARQNGDDLFIIDAQGKHVTPGMIDCHSHTGITGGVNEFMQVNTAEVRIQDVLDPDDINWYRQLAGGCTAVNQLHGSANPIGGQNAVTKVRWGSPMESYHVPDAEQGIKFALGENVKRSQGRYPNTRMGVETMMRDAFTAAREYDNEWKRYLARSDDEKARTMPPRRDLELEALVEILNGERAVHCHSYRQDEILMLLRLAEDFGFRVGTLQHILEGYKVADAIAAHGAGGSSFSDWWAYKMEVMDAIPHNAALMTEVGVLMSLNSDSNELARRLNTEASKAVRYGGMSRAEALKLVTINPAKQLGIDHRTGSLEVGKDGDFVIWSDDPLSTYARCEQTWIEGARYFSLDSDRDHRDAVQRERSRLVQKILKESHGDRASGRGSMADSGSSAGPGGRGRRPTAYDRTLEAIYDRWMRSGRTFDEHRPGECGCGELDLLRLEAHFAETQE